MKREKWVTNLIVDTDQLKKNLESQFEDGHIPITIMVKYGADGARDSNWIYGKITTKQTNKIFKFGIYLLTGKAVVLFIQDCPLWLFAQESEDKLKKECFDKIKRRVKKFYVTYGWSRQIDEFCGTQLTCYTLIDESQLQISEKSFIEGLKLEYKNLWVKKERTGGKMEAEKVITKVNGRSEEEIINAVNIASNNTILGLLVRLAEETDGLSHERKSTIWVIQLRAWWPD